MTHEEVLAARRAERSMELTTIGGRLFTIEDPQRLLIGRNNACVVDGHDFPHVVPFTEIKEITFTQK